MSGINKRVKERERERDSVRDKEQDRQGKKPQPTERERELGICFMMRFDSAATFSFPALLVNKSYRKK